jgi:hypothetical protein
MEATDVGFVFLGGKIALKNAVKKVKLAHPNN